MSNASPPPENRFRRWMRPAFGYLLAAACLVWVFHDVHPARLFEHLTSVNWGWIALAVVFDILSYVCQGLRWQLLLLPSGRISLLQATEAIYVGLFTNEVVPLRFGELVRAYLVARRLGASLVSVIPSMAVERLFDGVWLAVGIGLTAMLVPLPRDLLEAGDILGLSVLAGTAVFVYIVFRKQPAREDAPPEPSGRKPVRGVSRFIGHLAGGLRKIGISRSFFLSFGVSLFVLLLQAVAFWLVMWACGLKLSFWIGTAVLLIVHLGTAIPNAPANVGTYQFFTVVGLALFGVEKTLATGFSVVVFVILTAPLWALGLWALARSGMTLAGIREEIKRLKASEGLPGRA